MLSRPLPCSGACLLSLFSWNYRLLHCPACRVVVLVFLSLFAVVWISCVLEPCMVYLDEFYGVMCYVILNPCSKLCSYLLFQPPYVFPQQDG